MVIVMVAVTLFAAVAAPIIIIVAVAIPTLGLSNRSRQG
jgi:hypothetical protein